MLPVGMEELQKTLAFRSSFSAYLLQIQTLPTYQKCWTGQETTWEQVFLQDFWHFYIRFQMETPMRTASILVFLAHSVPILSGNLNWEGKEEKKKKKHQPFAPVFQNLKRGFSFELLLILGNRRQCSQVCLQWFISTDAAPERGLGSTHLSTSLPFYAQRSMSDNRNK